MHSDESDRPTVRAALALLALLAAPLASCSTLQSVARGTAELTGDATTLGEPAPFVKQSRRGEPGYIPIGATATVPVRPVQRRNLDDVKAQEAALDATRAQADAFAKRPAPPPLTPPPAAPVVAAPPAAKAAPANAKPAKPLLRTAPADEGDG